MLKAVELSGLNSIWERQALATDIHDMYIARGRDFDADMYGIEDPLLSQGVSDGLTPKQRI